jgi:hypothetical protein
VKGSIGPSARDDILRQYRYLLIEEDNPALAQRFLAAVQTTVRSHQKVGEPAVVIAPESHPLRPLIIW